MSGLGKCTSVVLSVAVSLAACGKDSPLTPTSPTQSAPPVVAASGPQTIEGTIEGTTAPDLIVVSGQRIRLNADATLRSGVLAVRFADLSVGARARVTAESSGGDALLGSLVDVLDPVGKPNFQHGMVESLSNNGSFFEFRFGSQLIRGDALTQIIDVTGPVTPSMLRNTVSIDVNGLLRTDYLYATRIGMDSTTSK